MGAIPPGCAILRECDVKFALVAIWTHRNCWFINNSNPLFMISLLANMDIHDYAPKYGSVSYVTPYITYRDTKGRCPFAYPENSPDQSGARALGGNKSAQFDATRFFNPQEGHSVKIKLDVLQVNWGGASVYLL